jgi:AcrR family transcriptional regulator
MARPRTLTDEQVLDRISATFLQADTAWTLAGAAVAAGLHPATLIKRFGSRHGLLLALSRHWIQAIPTSVATPDAQGELLAWASSLSTGRESSAQLLARVEMLGEDLRDDELRLLLHQGWTRHISYLSDLVQRCQDHGHLASRLPADTIACLLLDAAQGGLLRAAAHPHPAQAHPGRTLTALLEALA